MNQGEEMRAKMGAGQMQMDQQGLQEMAKAKEQENAVSYF